MSTVTASAVVKNEPRAIHAGLQSVFSKQLVTVTAASVVQMLKIPDGAVIVDGWVSCPADGFKVSVGDGGDPDRFLASATASAGGATFHRFNRPAGLGYKYSVSDDAIIKWDTIDILVGSASCTGTLQLCVTYYMDKA